jgi:hypothetical protein
MDPALSQVGLNYGDCVQNGLGNTFCGDAAEHLQRESKKDDRELKAIDRRYEKSMQKLAEEGNPYAQEEVGAPEAQEEVGAPQAQAEEAPGDVQESSDGTRGCGSEVRGWSLTVGYTTSCAFGRSTRLAIRRYQRQAELEDGDTFSVEVWSPVTEQSYRMECSVSAGVAGEQLLCSGGNGALVNFSRYQ